MTKIPPEVFDPRRGIDLPNEVAVPYIIISSTSEQVVRRFDSEGSIFIILLIERISFGIILFHIDGRNFINQVQRQSCL